MTIHSKIYSNIHLIIYSIFISFIIYLFIHFQFSCIIDHYYVKGYIKSNIHNETTFHRYFF